MPTVRFLGHSVFTISQDQYTVIIDPFLSGNPQAPIKPGDVRVDAVLLTHGHGDHLGDALDLAKRFGATIIACFELASYCGSKGAKTHPMHLGGGHAFPWGRVKLVPAWHGSGIAEGDRTLYGGEPAGLIVTMGNRIIYHAGDTALFGDMELIGRRHMLDLALLPIGDNFTMGIDDAVEAVRLLKPAKVVPMHYNTFPVIAADPDEFKKRVEAETQTQCLVLQPGEGLEV